MFYDILLCVIICYVTFVPRCGNFLALGYRVSCVVCRVSSWLLMIMINLTGMMDS